MIIFFLYLIMFLKIQKTRKLSGAGPAVSSIGSRMVFIVLTDFCCWIPIIIIGIASLLGMEAPPSVYAWVAVFVLPLNSALNPVLYTISTANFRRKFRRTLRKETPMTIASENTYIESRTMDSGHVRSVFLSASNEESNLLNGKVNESGVWAANALLTKRHQKRELLVISIFTPISVVQTWIYLYPFHTTLSGW